MLELGLIAMGLFVLAAGFALLGIKSNDFLVKFILVTASGLIAFYALSILLQLLVLISVRTL